jgi:hypothetical protein
MRAMFGMVALLIALSIVGILASRQLTAGSASSAVPATTTSAPATAQEQSRQLQQRVKSDVAGALQQGAERTEQADK